jgi:cell division septal protein FtsQ
MRVFVFLAETEYNSLMKISRRIGWSLLVVPLLLLGCGVYLVLNPHWIKIESVQIQLAPDSHEDLIFQRINSTLSARFQYFVGQYFWQVPLSAVYDLTNRDKRVRKVSVYREFPSKLRVVIEPHTPVLAYLSNDNRIYPVATDATLLPPISIADASDLPVLRGEDLKDEPHLREVALELFELIPNDGILRKKSVSEISHTAKDGFKIFVSGVGAEVKLGDSDFGPRVERVGKVLAYLDNQNIKGRVIDARFAKKVVVRVRNSP